MNGKLRAHGCVVLAVLALGGSAPCADGRDAEDAYADMSNTLGTVRLLPVRGRIVEEQDPVDVTRTTPGSQKSQEEFDHAGYRSPWSRRPERAPRSARPRPMKKATWMLVSTSPRTACHRGDTGSR